ncbi:MAG: hypothetical protein MUF58_10245 [Arcicella sp.]|jgi:KDO2-lipid IV(A) lauroyltransferase|nr:hypothetical protein [Arcicella sp.]
MFNEKQYLSKISQLRNRYSNKIDFTGNEGYMRNYFLTRANLFHLAPEMVKDGNDFEFFKNILFYQSWSGIDEQQFDFVPEADIDGRLDFLVDIDEKPRIFCTYHLGSYRMLNLLLTNLGVNFSLVIDNHTVETQGEKFKRLIEEFKQEMNPKIKNEFKILNAESPSIGLQMMREIKSGRSLVFYIDGNTGVGGVHRHDDKLTQINFLGKKFFARKGIAFISHATQTPIIPVLSHRVGDVEVKVNFYDAIIPSKQTEREIYCQQTTQRIYDLFSDVLRKYPEQWEGWLYVHKYMDIPSLIRPLENVAVRFEELENNVHFTFDKQRFGVFSIREQAYVFDRNTYMSHTIAPNIKDMLVAFNWQPTITKDNIMDTLGNNYIPINHLLSKQIITINR